MIQPINLSKVDCYVLFRTFPIQQFVYAKQKCVS